MLTDVKYLVYTLQEVIVIENVAKYRIDYHSYSSENKKNLHLSGDFKLLNSKLSDPVHWANQFLIGYHSPTGEPDEDVANKG